MTLKLKPASSASHKGQRPYQEDRLFVATYPQGILLGVFDGHGGNEAAQLAVDTLPGIFADEIGEEGATPQTALESSVRKLVALTQSLAPGSTLSLAFVKDDTVVCAVLGDSPIIIKDAEGKINISPEHNVRTNMEEKRAAEERGGYVHGGYLYSSYSGHGLQMARALGDSYLNSVLSRVPDIYAVKINKDSFVLVATDGAFDPAHYDFAKSADTVVKLVEAGAEAQAIVDHAVEIKTGDNVSAIVMRFEEQEEKNE